MYWIYLVIFIFIVLTPKMIQEGIWFFHEEDIEALIIFCFGFLGFVVYLAKEKALLSIVQEKLRLQKRTNIITKDLSDSYSYIGEMNRKFDIVKTFIFQLPKDVAETLIKRKTETFQSTLEAIKLLTKTNEVSLRFVNTKTKTIEKIIENGHHKTFDIFDAKKLLSTNKTFWEESLYVAVASPVNVKGLVAFVIFAKKNNHTDNVDVFKILAAQALLLFCINRYGSTADQKK